MSPARHPRHMFGCAWPYASVSAGIRRRRSSTQCSHVAMLHLFWRWWLRAYTDAPITPRTKISRWQPRCVWGPVGPSAILSLRAELHKCLFGFQFAWLSGSETRSVEMSRKKRSQSLGCQRGTWHPTWDDFWDTLWELEPMLLHLFKVRACTRKMCACSAYGEVFCVHTASRAWQLLPLARETLRNMMNTEQQTETNCTTTEKKNTVRVSFLTQVSLSSPSVLAFTLFTTIVGLAILLVVMLASVDDLSSQRWESHHVEVCHHDVGNEDDVLAAKWVCQFSLGHSRCSLTAGSSLSFPHALWLKRI